MLIINVNAEIITIWQEKLHIYFKIDVTMYIII